MASTTLQVFSVVCNPFLVHNDIPENCGSGELPVAFLGDSSILQSRQSFARLEKS